MDISLVMPNRNNLKYFKWAYESIRKNTADYHTVWICSAADACTDGTVEYYEELAKIDPLFKYIVNEGPERVGHTILYDRIVNELVETDIAMIYHCDMYLCPGALDAIEDLMYDTHGGRMIAPKKHRGQIVSLTRIEPPLHPPGKEKIIWTNNGNAITEPEQFDEAAFLDFYSDLKMANTPTLTNGVFAPWAFWVDEFKSIGGHDPLFKPQSKEDSDYWNRYQLKYGDSCFKQTWAGHVYHLTCRGSRYNPTITAVGTNSSEWEQQNIKSTRNFIRKWGHFVRHDEYLKPIVPHKYDIAAKIRNCTYNLLANLEPWFSRVEVDVPKEQVQHYVENESVNTSFDLEQRVCLPGYIGAYASPDMILYIDGNKFTGDDFFNIQNLSDIITESDVEPGMEYEIGNMRLKVNNKKTYEHELIVCQK